MRAVGPPALGRLRVANASRVRSGPEWATICGVLERSLQRARSYLARSRPYLRLRDLMVRGGSRPYWVHREDLARRYLCGDGIELGALTKPLRVPPDVRVRYVDRLPVERLIQAEGPGLRCAGIDPQAMVHVDVVDDASTLATFPDRSVDFVIANHVLEHLEDPVCALENMLRVLRRGGVLLLTLPDPRYTFDRRRSRTTVEHVIKDHTAGPATSRYTHYEEWAREIEGREDAAVPGRVAESPARTPAIISTSGNWRSSSPCSCPSSCPASSCMPRPISRSSQWCSSSVTSTPSQIRTGVRLRERRLTLVSRAAVDLQRGLLAERPRGRTAADGGEQRRRVPRRAFLGDEPLQSRRLGRAPPSR